MDRLRDLLALIVAILVPLAVGGIGGLATAPAIPTWYDQLQKPAWNPPGWVFGPVWTVLYLMMGVAAWLVWRKGWSRSEVRLALILFAVQLALNLAWSLLFFGLHSPGLALGEIVILWAAISATILLFLRVDVIAGLLLVPYLLWVTFATVLNASIWWLNR